MQVPVLWVHEQGSQSLVGGAVASADGVGQIGGVAAAQCHAHEVVEAVALEGALKGHLVDDHVLDEWNLVFHRVLAGGELVVGLGQGIEGVALRVARAA